MTHTIETRQGLPTEMQALLRAHPRDTWPDHPNFAESVQNWMRAHLMFKDLTRALRESTEDFVDQRLDDTIYLTRLARYGNALVGNLHGHHTWEDRKFFPELREADRRFSEGLDLLEADHELLDAGLHDLTESANRTIKIAQLDPSQVRDEAAKVLEATTRIGTYLDRHLADEEDLAVPIILHHQLRG
ncbi:MAG: hemerythrin domain-containing protein [Paracoccaceae bacterium]